MSGRRLIVIATVVIAVLLSAVRVRRDGQSVTDNPKWQRWLDGQMG